MMGIEGVGRPPAPRVLTRTRTGAGFALPPQPQGADQATAAAAAPEMTPAALLALQEPGAETVEDREARRQGKDMLSALTELQRALLGGGDDAAALQRLTEWARAVPRASDPRLTAMLSAIVLRARVELARRQIRAMAK